MFGSTLAIQSLVPDHPSNIKYELLLVGYSHKFSATIAPAHLTGSTDY